MEKLLTTKEVANIFGVDNRTITQKFIKEGLKYFPVGKKDFRFDIKDIEEFLKIKKQLAQEEIIQINPIKQKTKHKTVDTNYQKKKINLEQMKVV